MNKLAVAMMAMASAATSLTAFADPGNFFVNGGIGQANYRLSNFDSNDFVHYKMDKKDLAGALRFGYVWHSAIDYGVELGYVDLGQAVFKSHFLDVIKSYNRTQQSSRGWLLGGNLKFNFAEKWYVSARAGWYRSRVDYKTRVHIEGIGLGEYQGAIHETGTGEYAGVGVGYNILPQLSVGLNYDNYHSRPKYSHEDTDFNTALYSLSAEYRF